MRCVIPPASLYLVVNHILSIFHHLCLPACPLVCAGPAFQSRPVDILVVFRSRLCLVPVAGTMLTLTSSAFKMAQAMERSPHAMPLSEGHARDDPLGPRTVPILTPTIQMSGPPESDPMDITTPANSSAPPSATKSPDRDTNGAQDSARTHNLRSDSQAPSNPMAMAAPPTAAPAVQGPKIVQTAFIHKLYK